METSGALSLQSCRWTGMESIGRSSPARVLRVVQRFGGEKVVQKISVRQLRSNGAMIGRRINAELKIQCSYKRSGALESETLQASVGEALVLKGTAESVAPCLSGRCIYLVGMMGSGKTTVGKLMAEALGYSFCDSDKLIEQTVGGISVAQIFKEYNENFFRDNETKVLHELSSMSQLVVATGGGAVIRPINWKHMKKGITVWLDVPLEALARRIAAVGTASRPLLDQESGDPYTKAFMRLSALSDERGEAYANADARVSLSYIATKQGQGDVNSLTPTAIATEALIRIEEFLKTSRLEEVHFQR